MKMKHISLSSLPFLLPLFSLYFLSLAQTPPIIGYPCSINQSTYPCQTYAFFRASGPDLGSVGDLFSISRLMISNPSNILSPTFSLLPNQPLFIPLSCGCNYVKATITISFANITFTIQKGDTFFYVSTYIYQNLTTYQSVEVVNPSLVPTQLKIGVDVIFPIFCKCPNISRVEKKINYLISYVFQPTDNLSNIASFFGSSKESIIDVNGDRDIKPFETIFIPVSNLPKLKQPVVSVKSSGEKNGKIVLGLGIALGICGFLLVFIFGFLGYRERFARKREEGVKRREKGEEKEMEVNLIANVSDCLDKYRVFGIEDLKKATDGFDKKWLIQGEVYKGCIDGEIYAIKKMKWNACEELKILQKVNHGNLVKLEGFCIELEDENCYLVYEYVENGSLHSFLHENKEQKLNWKTRVRIAIDVANGLQYIHEHTTPRVVHKDIKSANILLDANMRAKIANFGLARSGCNAITTKIVGTQGYIAPEYVSNGVVSIKTDVFAFGVVLLELVAGREAVGGNGEVLWRSVDGVFEEREERREKSLMSWMDSFLFQENCSMESVMNVMDVALACLNKSPSKRPNMVDISYALCRSDEMFSDNSNDMFSPRVVIAR